jgi:hypothetical protein
MGRQWKMVHGHTHSWNAREAQVRGEMPITRAVAEVYSALDCKKYKVSKRTVRLFLERHCGRG